MDKERANNIIINRFNLPKDTDIVFYRNPYDFCNFISEKINPNHIWIIRGLPLRKIRKNKKTGFIKMAKIIINTDGFLCIDKLCYIVLITFSLYFPITVFSNLLLGICFYNFIYWLKKYTININSISWS